MCMKVTGVACVALFLPDTSITLFTTDCLMSKRCDYFVPFLIYTNACDLGIPEVADLGLPTT